MNSKLYLIKIIDSSVLRKFPELESEELEELRLIVSHCCPDKPLPILELPLADPTKLTILSLLFVIDDTPALPLSNDFVSLSLSAFQKLMTLSVYALDPATTGWE